MADPPLLILLHGVKAGGGDMRWLAGALSQHLAGALFAQPDAPFPYDQGGPGRQWFSTAAVTQTTRGPRVIAARPAFDAVLRAVLAQYGRADDLSRVALVGFSQGAIMALDAVASGRWHPVGAVGFSGRLAVPPQAACCPVLLVHGSADGVVPPGETDDAARALRGAGTPVRTRFLPGLGHIVSAEGAGIAGRFLARLFAV